MNITLKIPLFRRNLRFRNDGSELPEIIKNRPESSYNTAVHPEAHVLKAQPKF